MAIDFQPNPPKVDFQPSALPPSTDLEPVKAKIDFKPVSFTPTTKATDSGLAPRKKSALGAFAQPFLEFPSEVGKAFDESTTQVRQGEKDVTEGGLLNRGKGVLEMGLGAMGQLSSPLTGANKAFAGNPLQRATGIPSDYTDLALSVVEPLAGAKYGKLASAAKKATSAEEITAKAATAAKDKKNIDFVADVGDQLFENSNKNTADKIEMTQRLKTIQGVPEATFEKLQQYEESGKKLPLTPEEQKVYDEYFAPIAQESKEHVEYLKSKGAEDYELQADDYTPRQVKGSGSPTDRILDKEGPPKSVKGKSISTFASATKGRSFFSAETAEGRKVVYADKDGQVFDAANKEGPPIGYVEKGTKPGAGAEAQILGKPVKLETAKIPEIEAATKGGVEYHKNLLATRVTNLMQLRRARRNVEMIERWKQDPEFTEQMRWKGSNEEVPADFRYVNGLPREFEGARFSPQLAEQLEDFLPRIKNTDALSKIEKVGRFTRASIFFWPVTHMGNITYQYGMSKGLAGLVTKLPSTVKNLASGFRAVATQNKEYMKYLQEGASLPYAGEVARKFPDELRRAMGTAAQQNPAEMSAIAKAFGYANPVEMVKKIYTLSNKALWSYGDALAIARIKDLEQTGLSTKAAIKEAERVLPNYRVPSRIAGQRWLSQGVQNPLTAEFGRYQYNVLKSFAEVWNKIKDPATRARGLDQAAFVAFMAAIGYPLLDKLAQQVTSNPNAEFKKSGAGKVLQNALDVPGRKKNVRQAIMSSASPGMLTAPLEALMNTNLYTGGKIYNDQDLQQGKLGRVGADLAGFAAGQVGPIQQGMAAASGKSDVERFLEGLMMIQNPTPAQVNARMKAQNFLAKQQGRDANKRGF